MSRVVLFGNNAAAVAVARYLRERGDNVVAVVVHPRERAKYRDEIVDMAGNASSCTIEASDLDTPHGLERLAEAAPSLGVSVFFGYILKRPVLSLFRDGVVNLHPALLPHNRGAFPNVWAIVDGTPAGVTIHFVDEGIDTGDIIVQRQVPISPTDTGASLYRRLETCCIELFRDTWPQILAGSVDRRPQMRHGGTYHRVADVETIDRIDLDAPTTARQIVDRIRARTFPPYNGCYFVQDGRRIYLRLELYETE